MSKKKIAAIAIYLGLIAVCCFVLYIVPSVQGMLERTYTAEYGSIDVTDEVSAFIVRDEIVYVAGTASKIRRKAEKNELVKARSAVVTMIPDTEAVEAAEEAAAERSEQAAPGGSDGRTDAAAAAGNAGSGDNGRYTEILKELGSSVKVTENGRTKDSGYVRYEVDGAESKLSVKNLDSLKQSDLTELTGRSAVSLPSSKCAAGSPVFKIVRNAKWYLVYYLSREDAAKYEPGETVTIEISGAPVTVTVSGVVNGKKNSRITLCCKTFFGGVLDTRRLDTTVTVAHAEGLILEDSSIVEAPDGSIGVFVKNKLGEHVFKRVAKKADDGEKCAVFTDIYVDEGGNYVETISTYDEVIAEPTDEDIAAMKKQVAREQREKAEAEAAAEKAAEEEAARAAAEEAAAKQKAAEEAAKAAEEAAKAAEEAAKAQAAAEQAASEQAAAEQAAAEAAAKAAAEQAAAEEAAKAAAQAAGEGTPAG